MKRERRLLIGKQLHEGSLSAPDSMKKCGAGYTCVCTWRRGCEESKSSKRSVYLLFNPTVIDLVHGEVQNGKASAAKLYYDRFITNVFTKINKAFINQILERFAWSGDYSPSFCQIKLRFIGEMVFDFQRIRSRVVGTNRVMAGDIPFEDKGKRILTDCDPFHLAIMDIRKRREVVRVKAIDTFGLIQTVTEKVGCANVKRFGVFEKRINGDVVHSRFDLSER